MSGRDEGVLPMWRSMLYVPANVRKYVDKAHVYGADAIILDLEDSVAAADKDEARSLIGEAATLCARGGADVVVRVNRPLELAVRDIEAVVSPEVEGLLLPKVESADHVKLLAELVATVEARRGMAAGSTRFVIIVETAEAFARMWEIARADPRIVGMSLGSEDFALSTGSQPDPDVLLYPKQQVVLASAAAGIAPIGVIGSVASYQDLEGYREIVVRSRRFGFHGGTCIHPSLVPVLNEGFSPTEEEVAGAERIIAAFERANAERRASVEVDGKMVDIPVVQRAQLLLETHRRFAAKAAGADRLGP